MVKKDEKLKVIQHKTCNFKYQMLNNVASKHSVNITNDDDITEDDENVKSLGKLTEILNEEFNLDKPFEIKVNDPNSNIKKIEQFENFFDTTCKDFEIFLIN